MLNINIHFINIGWKSKYTLRNLYEFVIQLPQLSIDMDECMVSSMLFHYLLRYMSVSQKQLY